MVTITRKETPITQSEPAGNDTVVLPLDVPANPSPHSPGWTPSGGQLYRYLLRGWQGSLPRGMGHITSCMWGLCKTQSEMFRGVTKGREKERIHVSPHCACMRGSDHRELEQGCGLRNSYIQVPAIGENCDPGVDTGQSECLSSAIEGIHTDLHTRVNLPLIISHPEQPERILEWGLWCSQRDSAQPSGRKPVQSFVYELFDLQAKEWYLVCFIYWHRWEPPWVEVPTSTCLYSPLLPYNPVSYSRPCCWVLVYNNRDCFGL